VINDTERVSACGRRKVCGICGQKLERDAWLIGGPAAAFHEHGAYLDPPMHHDCATYALRVCPYIATRYAGRIDMALAKHGKWDARMRLVIASDESDLPQQPPFFVLAKPLKVIAEKSAPKGSVLRFHPLRPWQAVEFWHHGQQITEPEARALLASSNRAEWRAEELPHWPKAEVTAP
jgi:hypothetical protein